MEYSREEDEILKESIVLYGEYYRWPKFSSMKKEKIPFEKSQEFQSDSTKM